jgi:tRNA dimethylallyltransferase
MAESWPVEIVNCDSLQVYRYLDIGTAKLSRAERRGVPHHMIDLIEPDATFTAGEYARRARPILRSIALAGKLPVLVGGTGFYLRALLDGLFAGPERDDRLRRRLADREQSRPGTLHRILRRLDPISAARIHANDVKKLIRALEVCITTGQPQSQLFLEGRDQLGGFRELKIVLDPPRNELNKKIDNRAGQMFDIGLVAEVSNLLDRGFPPDSKPFESLGYRQTISLLQGRFSLEEAKDSTCLETRRYAKRQRTWFRKEPEAEWVAGFGDDPSTQAAAKSLVAGFLRSTHQLLPKE